MTSMAETGSRKETDRHRITAAAKRKQEEADFPNRFVSATKILVNLLILMTFWKAFLRNPEVIKREECHPATKRQAGLARLEITISLADVFHGASKNLTLQSYELGSDGKMQPVTRTLQVKIPKGITDGAVIRLAGQGEKARGRGSAGDLLLRIHIAPDSRFRPDGHDLYTVVAVSPWEAVLGAGIPVQTMEGTVTLSVPSGSQNGRRLRLRGKGLPTRSGSAGDIIVELEVRLPDHLTGEEERLFLAMAKASKFNPRLKTVQRAGSRNNG